MMLRFLTFGTAPTARTSFVYWMSAAMWVAVAFAAWMVVQLLATG